MVERVNPKSKGSPEASAGKRNRNQSGTSPMTRTFNEKLQSSQGQDSQASSLFDKQAMNPQFAKSMVEQPSNGLEVGEKIFPSLLEVQQLKYSEFMGSADVFVPDVILQRPRKRLNDMEYLRTEILQLNEEIRQKQEQILKRIHENVYDEATDEGYLEIDVKEYEQCYHIDFDGIKACLDEEVDRLRNELRKAQEDSDNLVQKMQQFLKQNHQIVQDFLKTSHKAVFNLAKPARLRGSEAATTNISIIEEAKSEATETRTETRTVPTWEAKLSQMQAFGAEQRHRLEWPTAARLSQLPLNKSIKLSSVELGFTQSLYQIRLNFTGGVKSTLLKTNQGEGDAQQAKGTVHKYEIDPSRTIRDVYINQGDEGDIYGFRVLDNLGGYVINERWYKPSGGIQPGSASGSAWKHFQIPLGKEIIGVHGSHDGTYIKSFGLIVWTPNPDLKKSGRDGQQDLGGSDRF